jgi:DNA-binding transcriptional ArsR family regulator
MENNSLSREKIAQLEKVFQVPARLRIMSVLLANKKANFSELINLLELTRGNLSMHMKMLEECKYITIKKQFVDNKPKTTYYITNLGKKDFTLYIEMLEDIIASLKPREGKK